MNRWRVQDPSITTGVNSLDTTYIPVSESLTREGILHNYEPVAPIQDPSYYMISLILKMIGSILMNRPTSCLTMKSYTN